MGARAGRGRRPGGWILNSGRARAILLATLLLAFPMATIALAAEPVKKTPTAVPPQVDEELDLLEFLGSIDAENDDKDWLDFLRSTDIRKVAKAKPSSSRAESKGT